jgi:hypothetical protein
METLPDSALYNNPTLKPILSSSLLKTPSDFRIEAT